MTADARRCPVSHITVLLDPDSRPSIRSRLMICLHGKVSPAVIFLRTYDLRRPPRAPAQPCPCTAQVVLPALQPNLSAPSQRLRVATLALLCCYDPPFAPTPAPAQVTPSHQLF